MPTDTELRAAYRARFQGSGAVCCTNLDFVARGGWVTHSLIFDCFDGLTYRLELYNYRAAGGPEWDAPTGGALDGWFACARAADNACIPAFLDWLLEHAPADLRNALDELVTRGVEPHPGD